MCCPPSSVRYTNQGSDQGRPNYFSMIDYSYFHHNLNVRISFFHYHHSIMDKLDGLQNIVSENRNLLCLQSTLDLFNILAFAKSDYLNTCLTPRYGYQCEGQILSIKNTHAHFWSVFIFVLALYGVGPQYSIQQTLNSLF